MAFQVAHQKPVGPTPIGVPKSAPTPPAWSEGPVVALTFNRTGSTYPLFVAKNTSRLSSAVGLHELSTDPKVALAQARLLSYNIEGRQPIPVGIFRNASAYFGAQLTASASSKEPNIIAPREPINQLSMSPLMDAVQGVVVGEGLFDMGIGSARDAPSQLVKTPRFTSQQR